MKRYFIEDVKCGLSGGGMACGPVDPAVNVSIKFTVEGDKPKWLSNSEVTGIPNFFLTEENVFDKLCDEAALTDEFMDWLNKQWIAEFDGVDMEDYGAAFASMAENPDNPAVPLVRYLITLSRCKKEDEENLIKLATGKYVDEIDVPLSEDEEEWIADNTEE